MTPTLLDSGTRLIALAIAALCAALAGAGFWRGRGDRWPTVLAACGAAAAIALLLSDLFVLAAVRGHGGSSIGWNDHRWVLLAPWGQATLIAGVAAAVASIVLGALSARRIPGPGRRAAIIMARAGATLGALVLFLEPAVELRQVAREPNRVAILVDDSLSMSLRDQQGGPSRLERAAAILRASAATFRTLRQQHHLDFYRFSDALVPATEATAATGQATGQSTLLRLALEQVRARYDDRDLAGIVVLSDGVDTGGLGDALTAPGGGAPAQLDGGTRDFLRGLGTRIHTVWAARPGGKDVAVAKILADEFAFVRTVVKIEAIVRQSGYQRRRIPVTLSSEGKQLRRTEVELGPGRSEARVVFEFTPAQVGKFAYEISTPVAADEAVAENNRRALVLRVIRDKIRVLQVAGQPSWDVRALRGMLEQNPNVDLISFFILRTEDDIQLVPNDEMSLIPFPTEELFEEELPSFDLIVLQNFNFMPYGIGGYLDNIRSYVERGGALAMLGGPLSFSSGLYAGTPVGDLLPVLLEGNRPGLIDESEFTPVLTDLGARHPITALRLDAEDNRATWAALPPLEGANLVRDARPDAAVLLAHPRLRTRSGKPLPIMAAGEYRQGRTLAIMTDSLWYWGFRAAAREGDSGRHYARLWENAIRWLIRDPELRLLHLESDRVEYAAGTPVALRARLLDRDYAPRRDAAVEITVEPVQPAARPGPPAARATQPRRHTLKTDEAGEATHTALGLAPGVYRARGSATAAGRQVTADDVFLVRSGSAELDQPAAESGLMAALAATTGGQFIEDASSIPGDLAFEPPRIVRVDQRSDIEVWSKPHLMFVVLLLLGLEWGLRQRSGYL